MGSKGLWRAFAREKFGNEKVDSAQLVESISQFLYETCPVGKVVSYYALKYEVNLTPLVDQIDPARLCLTRTPTEGMDLTIHQLDESSLERHRYGFMQPTASAPKVAENKVRVVLVPGLLFDQFGTRLGHGQGYYDRFLARMASTVHIVGVTKDIVLAEALPVESHDVPMTHLATSRGVEPVVARR